MTLLSAQLRALAAEPAPKGTSKSIEHFVRSRFERWDASINAIGLDDRALCDSLLAAARSAVRGSNAGSWNRAQYAKALALFTAHLAAETGAAS